MNMMKTSEGAEVKTFPNRRNGQPFKFVSNHSEFLLLLPSSRVQLAMLPSAPLNIDAVRSLVVGGKCDDALRLLDFMIRGRPNWLTPLVFKANLLADLHRFGESLVMLDQMISDSAPSTSPRIARGRCYLLMGQPDKARMDFETAEREEPSNPNTLFSLGLAYYRLDSYRESFRRFLQALDIDKDQPLRHYGGHCEMCGALVMGGREDLANEWVGKLWELKPAMRLHLAGEMGNAFFRLKRHHEALDWYNTAISLSPNDAFIYNERGRAHSFLRQYDLAMKDYDKAIRLDPGNKFASLNRGISHHKLGRYQEAISDLDTALVSQPNALGPKPSALDPKSSARGHYFRSQAHERLGNTEKAVADAEKALGLNQRNEYYARHLAQLQIEAASGRNVLKEGHDARRQIRDDALHKVFVSEDIHDASYKSAGEPNYWHGKMHNRKHNH